MKNILFALIGMMMIAGCNTVEGFGKDVTAGGKAVSNAAEKTKEDMKN